MATRRRGPTAQSDPRRTNTSTEATPTYAEPIVSESADNTRPDSEAALRARWKREHARRTWAFRIIREHIAAQPTPSSMRAVCRLWCRDLTLTTDALAQERQDQEHGQ